MTGVKKASESRTSRSSPVPLGLRSRCDLRRTPEPQGRRWLLVTCGGLLAVDGSVALFWDKAVYLAVPLIPATVYQLSVVVLGIQAKCSCTGASPTTIRRLLVDVMAAQQARGYDLAEAA
jgi:hypothetical protein